MHINGSSASIKSTSSEKDHRGSGEVAVDNDAEVCEICEAPGHDIFSCPLLKDESSDPVSAGAPTSGKKGPVETELFCEDCEGRGHLAADCPYSSDVF